MKRAILFLVLALGCIERPDGTRSFAHVDRTGLSEVLLSSMPTPAHFVGAQFEGIDLIGYDVSPEPASRGAFTMVTIYYRARDIIPGDWQVFVHLEDPGHQAQRENADHYPGNGTYHTNVWRKGDIIRDTFRVPVAAEASAIELWTGFFIDNDRLPLVSPGRAVNDGSNRIRIGTVPVQ